MGFTGVPLFIGGDKAQHSADASRLLPYAPFNGGEGVVRPTHCRIVEGDVPGGFVNMQTGAVVIEARGPQQFCQSYADTAQTRGTVNITPTDSSGSRSDLIIARVEDPYDGSGLWPVPEDQANGPYLHLRVIENVPQDTTTFTELFPQIGVMSGIPLARLDIPASTATITQDMIVDLRDLAIRRVWPVLERNTHSGSTLDTYHDTDPEPVRYPRENGAFQVWVPPWATHMSVRYDIITAKAVEDNTGSDTSNLFGNQDIYLNGYNISGFSEWNEDWAGGAIRFLMSCTSEANVTQHQGTYIELESWVQFQGNANAAYLQEDNGTQVALFCYFTERTI